MTLSHLGDARRFEKIVRKAILEISPPKSEAAYFPSLLPALSSLLRPLPSLLLPLPSLLLPLPSLLLPLPSLFPTPSSLFSTPPSLLPPIPSPSYTYVPINHSLSLPLSVLQPAAHYTTLLDGSLHSSSVCNWHERLLEQALCTSLPAVLFCRLSKRGGDIRGT